MKIEAFVHPFQAKTDVIDAKMLAKYGNERHHLLEIYQKPSVEAEEIKELAAYLVEMKKVRAGEKNKLQSKGFEHVVVDITRTICALDAVISELVGKLEKLIEKDVEMRRKVEICCAYKGVGTVTATQLFAHIPELGRLSKNEIVSFAGCAHFARDSGTQRDIDINQRKRQEACEKGAVFGMFVSNQIQQNHTQIFRKIG